MKLTIFLFSLSFLFFSTALPAQFHEWSYQYTGSGDVDTLIKSGYHDFGRAVKTDSEHNVITAGFISGQADMDFSENEFIQGTVGESQFYLAKYDPQGNRLWSVPAFGNEGIKLQEVSLAIGAEDEIYLAGTINVAQDLDPGPDEFMLDIVGITDGILIRYSKDGVFEWAIPIASEKIDQVTDIAIDAKNNIVLTGIIEAATDFDPGPGEVIETPADLFTHSGFVARYTPGGEYSMSLLIDPLPDLTDGTIGFPLVTCDTLNNIYVSGYFGGGLDIDPGPEEYPLTAVGLADLFVAKYDEDGNLVLGFSLGSEGLDFADRVAVNDAQEIFLSGSLWPGMVDVDPGPDTFILETPASEFNGRGFLAKYSPIGHLDWAFHVGESGNNSVSNLQITGDGHLLGTLFLDEATDVDPGPGTTILDISDGNQYVVGFSQEGTYLWAESLGFIPPAELAIGALGEWYLTGNFSGVLDFDPGPGERWLESGINPDDEMDSRDAFLVKFSPECFPASTSGNLTDSLTVCSGSTFTLDIPADWELNNAVRWELYAETCGGVPLASAITGPLEGIAYSSGYWYVGAPNSCTVSFSCDSVWVSVVEEPSASLEIDGNQLIADVAESYEWFDCSTGNLIPDATEQTFVPGESGTYQAALTTGGCTFFTDCITFMPTSVHSPNASERVRVFPNPGADRVEIRLERNPAEVRWQLFDGRGELVQQGRFTGDSGQMDLSALPAGSYLLRVQTDREEYTTRLIHF